MLSVDRQSIARIIDGNQAMSCLANNDKSLETVHLFPFVKLVFMWYNTVLPPSAALERLFNSAGHIYFLAEILPYWSTHTHNRFTALWNLSGTTRVSRY